jgi:hypothetical protein
MPAPSSDQNGRSGPIQLDSVINIGESGMNPGHTKLSMTTCVATVLILLLGGCASNAEVDVAGDNHTAREPTVRCPSGYTMVCEAKRVGRIRFGRMGNENLDSCSCEPENFSIGRSQQPALPQ